MIADDVRGRFVWHELMTRDVPAAKKFYASVIGWKPQAWPLDPAYTVCQSDQGPAAGIFAITADFPAEMPAHWMSYVGTRDVDGTAAAAVRAGGSILKGPDVIEGAGRYAVLKDPQGAVFAILDPENARPEPVGMPPPGLFSWHELATSDLDAAFAFYNGLFGWEALMRMPLPDGATYLIFGTNGIQRGGIYNKPPDMPAPPHWLPYAQVADADAGWKSAESGGAKLAAGPMDVPGGSRVVTFFDPTGAAFAVVSTPASAQPGAEPAASAKPKPKAKPRKPKAKAKPTRKSVTPKARPKAKPKAKARLKSKASRKPVRKPAAKKKAAPRTKTQSARRKK
jgi:predicted enzyme related to lactoylglutathione lyase